MGARILHERRGRARRYAGLLGAAALFLAGCAVGPNYHPTQTETPLPAGWEGTTVAAPSRTSVATTEAPHLSEWWGVFNDPRLTQLVTEALKANLDLRTARSALRQARATRDVTAAGFWPNLNATASYQRGGPLGGGRAGDLFQDGLNASWQLDFFGGVRRGIEAADANISAADENVNNVLITVAAEVATDYVSLRAFQQRIQVARDNLKAQQHTAD